MSDFIFNNFDYIDYIKSEEDLKLFNRMKELEPELHKPVRDCIKAVEEVANIDRKLRGFPPLKIITVNNPNLN